MSEEGKEGVVFSARRAIEDSMVAATEMPIASNT